MVLRCKYITTLALVASLAACGTGTFLDDAGTLVGDKSQKQIEQEQALAAAIENKVPVQAVGRVEIGRTRNGILLTAFGTAPGLGYSLPKLRVRRGGQPSADGFLEFDFVATVPNPAFPLPPGNTRTRSVRADLPLEERALRGVAGIRVIGLSGGVQVPLGGTG